MPDGSTVRFPLQELHACVSIGWNLTPTPYPAKTVSAQHAEFHMGVINSEAGHLAEVLLRHKKGQTFRPNTVLASMFV